MDKVKDPVCGMMIEQKDAVASSTYQDEKYYFCSKDCKTEFDDDPDSYADQK